MFLIFIFIFKKQCFLILVNKGYIYIYINIYIIGSQVVAQAQKSGDMSQIQ